MFHVVCDWEGMLTMIISLSIFLDVQPNVLLHERRREAGEVAGQRAVHENVKAIQI